MRKIVVVAMVLFFSELIYSCPTVKGWKITPNPQAVGKVMDGEVIISTEPDSKQTVGSWNISCDNQIGYQSGEGTFTWEFTFDIPGKRKWVFSGEWTDKDGKSHTYFLGKKESDEFTVIEIKIFSYPAILYYGCPPTFPIKAQSSTGNLLAFSIVSKPANAIVTVDEFGWVSAASSIHGQKATDGPVAIKIADSVYPQCYKDLYLYAMNDIGVSQEEYCIIHPIECVQVVVIGSYINLALTLGLTDWSNDHDLEDPETEAFRHAWASCWITQSLGRSSAENWGHAHENKNADCVDKVKDEANNSVGREIGSTSGDCYAKAKEAFNDGKLLY